MSRLRVLERAKDHLLGVIGGIIWGFGGCFKFIAAGFAGVLISYAIRQYDRVAPGSSGPERIPQRRR